ncbi:MAG: hypothetical protein RQ982_12335, partial [Gammaproteobacteria bacterium]|nr:hypothetical protein [Gammaproteobacteria bacterium]
MAFSKKGEKKGSVTNVSHSQLKYRASTSLMPGLPRFAYPVERPIVASICCFNRSLPNGTENRAAMRIGENTGSGLSMPHLRITYAN